MEHAGLLSPCHGLPLQPAHSFHPACGSGHVVPDATFLIDHGKNV